MNNQITILDPERVRMDIADYLMNNPVHLNQIAVGAGIQYGTLKRLMDNRGTSALTLFKIARYINSQSKEKINHELI